ncbi:MAG TPA: glycerol kinase GlpK, partial [Tepidisphaeraceae bacterium]|nr:glycerol kinase GlpK [Tepidisphaeraceae bacterium]
MRYIAAIDQGTTSTRCILFDRDGIVTMAQREHEQIFPHPGWVEHDPIEIWHRTEEVIAQAIRSANVRSGDIAAIGIANQRETTIVWDRITGQPFCNAIVWQDTRTKEICDSLAKDGGQDRFRDRVGLPLATYFSGPKIKWILDNIPGVRESANTGRAIFGTVDSWLIWHLTGGVRGGAHVIDVTNASRTMLMNLRTLKWDSQMLDAMGVPGKMLPTIVSSSDPNGWGKTLRDGPFNDAIIVCGDLGDQHAALVGQACFEPGESKNTYGTGCFMLLNTGEKIVESKHGLLTTLAYQFGDSPPVYALEGSIAVTGALVQWLRDNLGIIHSSDEIESLAESAPDNGGVFIVPAFSGLFAPYWRSDARGVIVGLSRQSNRGHIARAALEATAFQTRDVVQAMIADSGVKLSRLKVDGGMCANELLMQFQADILGAAVVRPKITETTALGAAYAAGLAVGFWKNLDELRESWRADKIWQPAMKSDHRDKQCEFWN